MWTDKEINSDELINVLTEPAAYFRESRDELIGTCIDTVYKQHSKQNGECSDHVDVSISTQNELNSEKSCVQCSCEADVTYRTCRNCGGKLIKISAQDVSESYGVTCNPYNSSSAIPSPSQKISFTNGEPDFINTNSYEKHYSRDPEHWR